MNKFKKKPINNELQPIDLIFRDQIFTDPKYINMNRNIGSGMWDDFKKKLSDGYEKVKEKVKKRGSTLLTNSFYVGPWNSLDADYVREHPPTDIIDQGAKEHDERYAELAKLRDSGAMKKEDVDKAIRVSDEKFLKNIRDNYSANRWAGTLGYLGIKGKNLAEDYLGLDRNKFVAEGRHLHHYIKIHKQLSKAVGGKKCNLKMIGDAIKKQYITKEYIKNFTDASKKDHALIKKIIKNKIKQLEGGSSSSGYMKLLFNSNKIDFNKLKNISKDMLIKIYDDITDDKIKNKIEFVLKHTPIKNMYNIPKILESYVEPIKETSKTKEELFDRYIILFKKKNTTDSENNEIIDLSRKLDIDGADIVVIRKNIKKNIPFDVSILNRHELTGGKDNRGYSWGIRNNGGYLDPHEEFYFQSGHNPWADFGF